MILRIDRRIYPDCCISKVVYWFSNQYDIVTIDGSNDEHSLKKEFLEKLNDYKLRGIIETETKDIRTILYAKAFGDFDDITEEEISE